MLFVIYFTSVMFLFVPFSYYFWLMLSYTSYVMLGLLQQTRKKDPKPKKARNKKNGKDIKERKRSKERKQENNRKSENQRRKVNRGSAKRLRTKQGRHSANTRKCLISGGGGHNLLFYEEKKAKIKPKTETKTMTLY